MWLIITFLMFSLRIINVFAVFVQFDMEEYSVEENDGPVEIQLMLNEMPGVAVNATVTTADLTAGMLTIRFTQQCNCLY